MAPVVDVEMLLIDSGRRLSEGTTGAAGGGGGILGLLLILLLLCYCKEKGMGCFARSSGALFEDDGAQPPPQLTYNPGPVYIPDPNPIPICPSPDPRPPIIPPAPVTPRTLEPHPLGPMHYVNDGVNENYYYETKDSDGQYRWHRARHTGFDTGPGNLRSGQYASREEIERAKLDWNGYLGH